MVKEVEAEEKKMEDNVPVEQDKNAIDALESADRIGSLLHHERMKKGLELDVIAPVLCIRKMYLEAIENGNYVELPPLPYSVGFVNSYAKYLGLNNVRIAQLFREELNAKPKEKRVFIIEEPVSEARLPNKSYVIGGVLALILISLLWSFWFGSAKHETEENAPAVEKSENAGEVEYFSPSADENDMYNESTVSKISQPEAADAATEKTVEVSQIEVTNKSYVDSNVEKEPVVEVKSANTVEIRVTKENTWLEIKDSKKVYLNKVLHPGESFQIPEGDGIILSAGKYQGVEVYINGVLTPVITASKKMNVSLDSFLKPAEH